MKAANKIKVHFMNSHHSINLHLQDILTLVSSNITPGFSLLMEFTIYQVLYTLFSTALLELAWKGLLFTQS